MKPTWRPCAADARGATSLAEMLALAAILGLMAVMLAPVESFLWRRLAEIRDVQGRSPGLATAAEILSGDLRRARAVSVEDSVLTLVMPGGEEVVWSVTARGLERRDPARAPQRQAARCFPAVAVFDAKRPRRSLLLATLGSRSGRTHVIEIWLRNDGASP